MKLRGEQIEYHNLPEKGNETTSWTDWILSNEVNETVKRIA